VVVDRIAHARILETLKVLSRVERAMAGFYALCAEAGGPSHEFWLGLEREEHRHVGAIRRMAELVAERPDQFEPNRAFHAPAVQTFLTYVESLVQRLRTNEISRTDQHHLLCIARDLEQSVLEGRWNEIVNTADPEFRALIRTITSETIAHKATIVGRLAATPNSS
jgi:hypothetical protein